VLLNANCEFVFFNSRHHTVSVLGKETRQIPMFYVPEYIHKEESYESHDTLLEHPFLFNN